MKYVLKNNVYQYRAAKNLSQEELAQLVDVSRQTINAIERGDYNPSTLLAMKIAKALGIKFNLVFYIVTENE